MGWIAVDDNVFGAKLRLLAKRLNSTNEEQAAGILLALWIWGKANNADKEGRILNAGRDDVLEAFSRKLLSTFSTVDIVDALIATGWLDETEDGELYIHDWSYWQRYWYKALETRERDAKRKAELRKKQKEEETKASKQEAKPEVKPKTKTAEKPNTSRFEYPLRETVDEWFAYKAEKKQSYKPRGAAMLMGKIEEQVLRYGQDKVIYVIRESMTNNYQGIVWDWISRAKVPAKADQDYGENPFQEWSAEG